MAFLGIFLLVIGFAPVTALETSTFEMLSILNGSQTAMSQVPQYNMTNSTDSPYTTPPNIPLSTTSPNTTGNSTTPTMVETGSGSYTPGPGLTTKNEMTSPMPTPEKMTTTVVKGQTKVLPPPEADETTGIVILVIIIIVALGFGLACYFARKKGRRYSVDFTSRPDEANIPLSTMEPDPPVDTAFQNGLQTFESPGAASNQAQESETTPEARKEQRAEAEKTPANPDAESAAPAATPGSAEDKPKEDVAEPSSSTATETTVDEKTDDEGVVSKETSVESLKETNVNNSNSRGLSPQREFESSDLLWDVVSTSV
ncbi:uncharacterized protein LOC142892722 [Nelusetta ayraudi]|uniref:uncharacterized protein LOC142892722 n=1 Tax=Nelusetta ayraudi TaxID=303726 RepID=UPI003F70D953